jgi:hypothetical protein
MLGDILHTLLISGQAQVVKRYGKRFWSAAAAHYAAGDSLSGGGTL